MNLHMWDALVEACTRSSVVHLEPVAARRHGHDGQSFYWDAARDGMAVLDHLGVSSATWVGHSQGGFTAMRAALVDPTRVERLVLIDTMSHAFGAPDLAQMGQVRDGFAGGDTEGTARLLLWLLVDSPTHEQVWLPHLVQQRVGAWPTPFRC